MSTSVLFPQRPGRLLRLSELAVRRGATLVVDGLDWTFSAGRMAWIVGPNGAGKSSLLRVMAGLDTPAAGAVERLGGAARPLYYHAEMALPPESTVADWRRLVDALLAGGSAGPTPLWPEVQGRRRVGLLSTGERKRLLLDVLLRQPGDVLLLDEPYEHLSPDAKATLTALLEARATSAVVVVATNQLTTLAARDGGLRLEGGRATPLDGPP